MGYNAIPDRALPGTNIPTAAEIADAVWDEALSGHTTAGTAGKTLSDLSTAVTNLPGKRIRI